MYHSNLCQEIFLNKYTYTGDTYINDVRWHKLNIHAEYIGEWIKKASPNSWFIEYTPLGYPIWMIHDNLYTLLMLTWS